MSAGVPPTGEEKELAYLFNSSLYRGYGSDGGRPFYARTALSGPLAEAGETSTLVAYCAAYPGQKPLSYIVMPQKRHKPYSQGQLMEVLVGPGTPDIPEPDTAALQLLPLQHVMEMACLLAAPWRLPVLAVVHVVTETGEDCVEFVAPRLVDSDALIRYMRLGLVTGR